MVENDDMTTINEFFEKLGLSSENQRKKYQFKTLDVPTDKKIISAGTSSKFIYSS